VVCAGLGVGGWFLYRRLLDAFTPSLPAYGNLGDLYFLSENDQTVMLYWPAASSEPPQLRKPLWLLVVRPASAASDLSWSYNNPHDSAGGWELNVTIGTKTRSGQELVGKYEASSARPGERISAGEQSFDPEAGRVFLVDPAAQPAEIIQVGGDLASLFPSGAPPVDVQKELWEALEKLRAQQEPVRSFLARRPGKSR
jgi:hypothetical protein